MLARGISDRYKLRRASLVSKLSLHDYDRVALTLFVPAEDGIILNFSQYLYFHFFSVTGNFCLKKKCFNFSLQYSVFTGQFSKLWFHSEFFSSL